MIDTDAGLDVYPVGWLAAWQHRKMGHLDRQWRYLVRMLRAGKWHEIRMSFNGYLAEPHTMPPGVRRCGSGWTKRRAIRRFERECRKVAR